MIGDNQYNRFPDLDWITKPGSYVVDGSNENCKSIFWMIYDGKIEYGKVGYYTEYLDDQPYDKFSTSNTGIEFI